MTSRRSGWRSNLGSDDSCPAVRSTRRKPCYSGIATAKNEVQMLRRFVSIGEKPNPSMTPAE
jgi:hypothetical protein